MDVENIKTQSLLITREKEFQNYVYSLKNKGYDTDYISSLHSSCMYNLLRGFSATGFNIQLDEPEDINIDYKTVIERSLDDLQFYFSLLKNSNQDLTINLQGFINVKIQILKMLFYKPLPDMQMLFESDSDNSEISPADA